MKAANNIWVWCLFAISTFLAQAINAQGSNEIKEEFDQILNPLISERRLPGYYLAVFKDGKKEFEQSRGFADEKKRMAPSGSILYSIEAMTEPLTAAAVMVLVEQKKIKLNDPLASYLPEFKTMNVAKNGSLSGELDIASRPIMIKDLIAHQSGFTQAKRYSSNMTDVQNAYRSLRLFRKNSSLKTLAEHVTALAELPLVHHPGTRVTASISYDVLARVAEVVSGKAFSEFLSETVLKPLAMTDTHFLVPKSKGNRVAAMYEPVVWGYNVPGTPKMYRRSILSTQSASADADSGSSSTYIGGSSGLMSTGDDYAKFLSFLMGSVGNPKISLSPDSRKIIIKSLMRADKRSSPSGGGIINRASLGSMVKEPLGSVDFEKTGSYVYLNGQFNTSFWIDSKTQISGLFMTQLSPSQFDLVTVLKDAANRNFTKNL